MLVTLNERTTLKTTEIADEMRVAPSTVRRWIREGYLRAVRFGRTIRVYADDFEDAKDFDSQQEAEEE